MPVSSEFLHLLLHVRCLIEQLEEVLGPDHGYKEVEQLFSKLSEKVTLGSNHAYFGEDQR